MPTKTATEETVEVEDNRRTQPREIRSGAKPTHLVTAGSGVGRARIPTEFDDLIPEWYESEEWFEIPATDEEDMEEVYKAVKRAADLHEKGLERLKDEKALSVWVYVRDKQARGPVPGSIRDSDGKMVRPGTERYDEIMAERNGDKNPNVVSESDHEF